MRVGIPNEVKDNEYRVAITPAGARELTRRGHTVFIEKGAGVGSSIPDDEFAAIGATILDTADEVWAEVEHGVQGQRSPSPRIRSTAAISVATLVLFTYLHLAASRPCTDASVGRGTTAIAYETVQLADGSFPLLTPMSEVAGRMAPLDGGTSPDEPGWRSGAYWSAGCPGVRCPRWSFWAPAWPAWPQPRWPSGMHC